MNHLKTFENFIYENLTFDNIDNIIKIFLDKDKYTIERDEKKNFLVKLDISNDVPDYDKISDEIKLKILDEFGNDIYEIYSDETTIFTIYTKPKKRKSGKKYKPNGIINELSIPVELREKMDGVSLGKDNKGFYVYTHRARCSSYPTPDKIPESKIKFIKSTG